MCRLSVVFSLFSQFIPGVVSPLIVFPFLNIIFWFEDLSGLDATEVDARTFPQGHFPQFPSESRDRVGLIWWNHKTSWRENNGWNFIETTKRDNGRWQTKSKVNEVAMMKWEEKWIAWRNDKNGLRWAADRVMEINGWIMNIRSIESLEHDLNDWRLCSMR